MRTPWEASSFREQGEFIVTFLKGKAEREGPALLVETPNARGETLKGQALSLDQKEEARQTLALRLVHKHGAITNQQYRELTRVSVSTALRDLERLVEQGTLRASGKRRSRKYML